MLCKGQKFTLGGRHYKVDYVNASRAHCTAREPRTVTVSDGHGGTRTFTARQRTSIDISPNTCIEVLAELGL